MGASSNGILVLSTSVFVFKENREIWEPLVMASIVITLIFTTISSPSPALIPPPSDSCLYVAPSPFPVLVNISNLFLMCYFTINSLRALLLKPTPS